MALNSFTQQDTVNPEAVQPRFLNDDDRERFSGPRVHFPPELRNAGQQRSDIAGGHAVFCDIFSPRPGDNDVTSQVDRLSSNEMNIAQRSAPIVVGATAACQYPVRNASAIPVTNTKIIDGFDQLCFAWSPPEWVVSDLMLPNRRSLPSPHRISKRTMCRPTRRRFRGRLIRLGEMSEDDAQSLHRGSGGSTYTRKARATREAPWRGQG